MAPPKHPKTPSAKRPRPSYPSAAPSPPSPRPCVPPPSLDPSLLRRIIIAKLEASKSFDWYALSQELFGKTTEEEGSKIKGRKAAAGKAGKRAADGKDQDGLKMMGGTELRDLYYHAILPALKSGSIPWTDPVTPYTEPQKSTPHLEETADIGPPRKKPKVLKPVVTNPSLGENALAEFSGDNASDTDEDLEMTGEGVEKEHLASDEESQVVVAKKPTPAAMLFAKEVKSPAKVVKAYGKRGAAMAQRKRGAAMAFRKRGAVMRAGQILAESADDDSGNE